MDFHFPSFALGAIVMVLIIILYVAIEVAFAKRREEELIWREHQSPSETWIGEQVRIQESRNIADSESDIL